MPKNADDKLTRTRHEFIEDLWLTGALIVALGVVVLTTHLTTGLAVFLLGGVAPVVARRAGTNAGRRRYGIAEFDALPAREFVKALATRFRLRGYKVRPSPAESSHGYDFLLLRRGGLRIAVQVQPASNAVEPQAVRRLVAGMRRCRASEGWLMSNGPFSEAVRDAASDNDIVLWDRARLATFLMETAPVQSGVAGEAAEE